MKKASGSFFEKHAFGNNYLSNAAPGKSNSKIPASSSYNLHR